MAKKYYSVVTGLKPGIYDNWPECEKQIKGYKAAYLKGFNTQQGAIEHYKSHHTHEPTKHYQARKKKAMHRVRDYIQHIRRIHNLTDQNVNDLLVTLAKEYACDPKKEDLPEPFFSPYLNPIINKV